MKFPKYLKEIFLDSDTKVAVLSGAPSDIPEDWMLSNDAIRDALRSASTASPAGGGCCRHFIFVPGHPVGSKRSTTASEVLKPSGWKGYTIGDNTHKEISRYPWRMDDEKGDLSRL